MIALNHPAQNKRSKLNPATENTVVTPSTFSSHAVEKNFHENKIAYAEPNLFPVCVDSSGLIGVENGPRGYLRVRIDIGNHKKFVVGLYRSPQVAAWAYDLAVVAFGFCERRRNFPQEEIVYSGSNSPNEVKSFVDRQVRLRFPEIEADAEAVHFRGVRRLRDGKWASKIVVSAIAHLIGYYESSEQAAWGYDAAMVALGRYYKRRNFPDDQIKYTGSGTIEDIKWFSVEQVRLKYPNSVGSNFIGVQRGGSSFWVAEIPSASGDTCDLGRYVSAKAAAFAYDAALVASGGRGKRNFPEEKIVYSGSGSIDDIKRFAENQVAIKYPNSARVNKVRKYIGVKKLSSGSWDANIWMGPGRGWAWLGAYRSAEAAAFAYDAALVARGGKIGLRNFPQHEIVYSGSGFMGDIKRFCAEQVSRQYPDSVAEYLIGVRPRVSTKTTQIFFRGISKIENGRWEVRIQPRKRDLTSTESRKCIYLGTYDSPEVAAFAYDAGLVALGMDYIKRNFPEEKIVYSGPRTTAEIKLFVKDAVRIRWPEESNTVSLPADRQEAPQRSLQEGESQIDESGPLDVQMNLPPRPSSSSPTDPTDLNEWIFPNPSSPVDPIDVNEWILSSPSSPQENSR